MNEYKPLEEKKFCLECEQYPHGVGCLMNDSEGYVYSEYKLKEALKRIESKLLQKYKFASMPIIRIITEEMGKSLLEEER